MDAQTPEQLQFVSNLAHWIEGALFAVIASIALIRALGYARWNGAQYLWPLLIVIGGLFLPAYIVLQNGLNQIGERWSFIANDPQQLEHFAMALLLVLAGIGEIIGEANSYQPFWKLMAPGALIAIGSLLFLHTEYGTPEAIAESVTQHRYQGSLVVLVGISKVADVLWQRRVKWLAYPWIVLLFITALMLIRYREPEGAYRVSNDTQTLSSALLPPYPKSLTVYSGIVHGHSTLSMGALSLSLAPKLA